MIGRRVELDGTAEDANEVPQVPRADMGESDSNRPDLLAGGEADGPDRHGQREFRLLSEEMAREAGELVFERDAVELGSKVQARALVGDADIARHQLQGFAENLCSGSDIEDEPDRARVSLRREVKPQGAVSQGLGRTFEESRLRRGGHPAQRIASVLLGQARPDQQRPRFYPGSLQAGERWIDRETNSRRPSPGRTFFRHGFPPA